MHYHSKGRICAWVAVAVATFSFVPIFPLFALGYSEISQVEYEFMEGKGYGWYADTESVDRGWRLFLWPAIACACVFAASCSVTIVIFSCGNDYEEVKKLESGQKEFQSRCPLLAEQFEAAFPLLAVNKEI